MERSHTTWTVPLMLLAAACGEVENSEMGPDAGMQEDVDASSPKFKVGGSLTGVAGRGVVLQLNNGTELALTADGTFQFPTELDPNAAYDVKIKTAPVCPQRVCTLSNGTGTIGGANVTNIAVSCQLPKIRLGSRNWGEDSIRITDDLAALADGATATPRTVVGASTGLDGSSTDSFAFDSARDLAYGVVMNAATTKYGVTVFANASTMSGNMAPARTIQIAGETTFYGIELDAANDRLYVSGGTGKLYVFASASTLDGIVAPTAAITIAMSGALTLDRINDRLYITQRNQNLHIFDSASQLTSASVPSRSISWTHTDFPRSLAIDGCRNRLYVANRNVSMNGHNIYALDNAHTLTGAIDIEAAAARATVPSNQVMSMALDSQGALYFWTDSANTVRIVNTPFNWSGAVAVTPDKNITAVVSSGYGLDLWGY